MLDVLVMLGSPLRAGVLDALAARDLAPREVLVPAGGRFDSVAGAVRRAGREPRPVRRREVEATLRALAAKTVVSVGWPFLLPAAVVEGPWLLLNSHPTLLPRFRGPNPWYHVIAAGQREAGVTVHRVDHGMDTGPVLHQAAFALTPFDTYRSLRARVLALEPAAVADALALVAAGRATFTAQDERQASSYPGRRTPADSEVDPRRPLGDLVDAIRACDPQAFPAFFLHHGQKVLVRLERAERPPGDHPDSL